MPEKHEETREGVRAQPSPYKKMEKDYDVSDVEVVYRRGDWRSWGDMIHWLETQGEADNELTPGEVIHMVQDLRRVEKARESFTKDPHRAYELAHKHREAKAA